MTKPVVTHTIFVGARDFEPFDIETEDYRVTVIAVTPLVDDPDMWLMALQSPDGSIRNIYAHGGIAGAHFDFVGLQEFRVI